MRGTALILALALAGCATPYQDMNWAGGVAATQVDATTLRITGRGNGLTDAATIKDYVMVKAAEETIRHGFDLFEILGAESETRQEVFGFGDNITTYIKPGQDALVRMSRGVKPANAPANLFAAREVLQFLGPSVGFRGAVPPPRPSVSPTARATAVAPPPATPVQPAGVRQPVTIRGPNTGPITILQTRE